jgi:uncharacterized protein (DUF2235 family)
VPKRLVVCCDGTWNKPDQASPTNVVEFRDAVATPDGAGTEQRVFYGQGVGTGRWDRLRGGALGVGLSSNVRDAYRFLVGNFEPHDELYLLGFSRGAYTARSVAGLVRNCGILRRPEAARIREAYDLYRDRGDDTDPDSARAREFRARHSHETRIRFIGVWDTVGSLGIPVDGIPGLSLLNKRWQFHDVKLSSSVDTAVQALAIDERRGPFKPTIWEPQEHAPEHQRVAQAWFAGVHSDVGGGYENAALSAIALRWIAKEAEACGLVLEPRAFASLAPDPHGEMHESRTGIYGRLKPHDRELGKVDAASEGVASSVVTRREKTPAYGAPGLVAYLEGRHQTIEI